MRVAVVQMNPKDNIRANLSRAFHFIDYSAKKGAELVVLPELFIYRGNPKAYDLYAQDRNGAAVSFFCALAREYRLTIVVGSIIEHDRKGRLYDTSFVVDSRGRVVSQYRKINLFDVALGRIRLRERDFFTPGTRPGTFSLSEHLFGLAICFDVRYAALFCSMRHKGVGGFCIPSNFTHKTGKAHWHVLLRARAIETQSYIFAANCSGIDPYTKVKSYGHSMIVDPWGRVITEIPQGEGVCLADADMEAVSSTRDSLRMGCS